MFTVQDIQKRYGVTDHTVLEWIDSGELKAINVGRRSGKKKPRWRISEKALADFEQLRTPTPTATTPRSRKRRTADVIEFYPVGSGK
jgi:excisionase family DNA binding protein